MEQRAEAAGPLRSRRLLAFLCPPAPPPGLAQIKPATTLLWNSLAKKKRWLWLDIVKVDPRKASFPLSRRPSYSFMSSFMPWLIHKVMGHLPCARLPTPGTAVGAEEGMSSLSFIMPASEKAGWERKKEEDVIRHQFGAGGSCSIYFLTRNPYNTGWIKWMDEFSLTWNKS